MAKFYRSEDKTVLLEVFGAGSSKENLKSLKAVFGAILQIIRYNYSI